MLSWWLFTCVWLCSPCNACQRSAFHSEQSNPLTGHPGWFPANSQWRGSFPRTTEPPTAEPESRPSPPWTPGHMGNLSKHTMGKQGRGVMATGALKQNGHTTQVLNYKINTKVKCISSVIILKSSTMDSFATKEKKRRKSEVKTTFLNLPPVTSGQHEVHLLNDFSSLLNY